MKLPDTSPQHPPLRDWQQRCVAQALGQLSATHPHFLCQATPGAGKMLMAAVLAHRLIQADEIDFVLYLGPSRDVVSRAESTLTGVTGLAMNGALGARGGCFTYQSLKAHMPQFQQLGAQSRVLLIWDESHHAARQPGKGQGANAWGEALLILEKCVTYTLALSGTPWRTDGNSLPLLSYWDEQNKADAGDAEPARQQRLMPDFVYSLREAVQEGVCRYPYITLIDNRAIQLTLTDARGKEPPQHKCFSSIPKLLRHPGVGYADLLRHDAPIEHVMNQGINTLSALRQAHPDAGGLVVASDIEHAEDIAQWLTDNGQSVCLVTSQTPNAHAVLEAFRQSDTAWVVSVGMISEGVDIPRLRVCCYLSRIRTEQHFRQVLGRIIRRLGLHDGDCTLFAINEPSLRRFAQRIADDLPEDNAVVSLIPDDTDVSTAYGNTTPPEPADTTGSGTEGVAPGSSSTWNLSFHPPAASGQECWEHDVAFSQQFIERLTALTL
jgi:superfamily II DNA or RNA helicase